MSEVPAAVIYTLIRSTLPDLDEDVATYSAEYADDPDLDDECPARFLEELFKSAGADETVAHDLAIRLEQNLRIYRQSASSNRILTKLDQAVQISSEKIMPSTFGLMNDSVEIDATLGRRSETRVNKQKLEKAEAKIKAKMDKRVYKLEYSASKLLQKEKTYEDIFMQVNPLKFGSSSRQKSKDVKIDGVDLYFTGNRLLNDASLTLAYGRRYGLVGINGIGKSSLLRALSRREIAIPSHITILHVEQEVDGDDTTALQSVLEADVWRTICLQEQDRTLIQLSEIELKATAAQRDGLSTAKVDRERMDLDEHLKDIHDKLAELDADTADIRAAIILRGLGFSVEAQQRPTKSFSGGWRMRLALARALFCRPDLLLLDEPSNMLDVPSVAFLAEYLKTYPSTVLVVSHDRDFLNEVATDIIYMHNERLDYYKGNFTSFQVTKEERKKNQLREYENQMAYRKHLQSFIDKFRYNANKASEAQSRIKKLEKLPRLDPPEEESSLFFRFPNPEKLPSPMLQMTGVSFGFTAGNTLLNDIDIDVQLSSRIGIIGANGSGKTTMLKLLTEQLHPQGGIVTRHPRLRIGYFAQHHIDALDLTVSPVAFLSRKYPGKSEEEYRRALGAFGITGLTGLQTMTTLSGGQKSRVAFAILYAIYPHILVLDEPTNHLDIQAMDALTNALNEFAGGVVVVSHDVRFLQSVCNELWLCTDGHVRKFSGTIKDYQKMVTSAPNQAGVVVPH